jgi:hypothetical protein
MCWSDPDVLFWKIGVRKLEDDTLAVDVPVVPQTFGREETPPSWRTLIKHFKLNETRLEGVENFVFESPMRGSLRSCDSIASSCPVDWHVDEVTTRCSSYTAYVYSYTGHPPVPMKYRNKDCAQCNNVTEFHCSVDDLPIDFSRINNAPDATSYGSIVTLFDLDHHSPGGGLFTQQCGDTEVYDPITEICRSLFCFTREGQLDEICTGNCSYVTFDHWEYVIHANDSAYLHSFATLIDRKDYKLKNQTLLVCEHVVREVIRAKFPFSSSDTVKGIVSLVGQILSMIGLVIHLVASALFPSLRRIPASKAIMSLDVSLLLGQIHLLVGSAIMDHFIPCKIFGILVHYFFLVSFMWMNVLAFDLASTFASTSVVSRDLGHATRRFVKYSVYAWFTPLILIAVAVAFDEVDLVSNIRPQYGKYVCWFGNPNAQLVFFLIPVAMVLIANMVMYLLTLYGICTAQREAKIATKRKADRCFLFIYFKLFVIMGLTWLFGFIGTVSNSDPIWYLFIVFNSMQGLFICFAFLCRKSIWHQATEKFTASTVVYRRARSSESTSSGKRVTLTTNL